MTSPPRLRRPARIPLLSPAASALALALALAIFGLLVAGLGSLIQLQAVMAVQLDRDAEGSVLVFAQDPPPGRELLLLQHRDAQGRLRGEGIAVERDTAGRWRPVDEPPDEGPWSALAAPEPLWSLLRHSFLP